MIHDRRADGVNGQHGDGRTSTHRFVEEDKLLDLAPTLAAVFLGPANSKPTVIAHLANDLARPRADAVLAGQIRFDLGRQ